MITLYHQCREKQLEKMTVKELYAYYHDFQIQGSGKKGKVLKSDIIQHIKLTTLTIGNVGKHNNCIMTIGIKMNQKTIYTEVMCSQLICKKLIFEKINQSPLGEQYRYTCDGQMKILLYHNNVWHFKIGSGYGRYKGDFHIMLNQLRKIAVFLEVQEWYCHLTLLHEHLIQDIVHHIVLYLINHFQLDHI